MLVLTQRVVGCRIVGWVFETSVVLLTGRCSRSVSLLRLAVDGRLVGILLRLLVGSRNCGLLSGLLLKLMVFPLGSCYLVGSRDRTG